MRESESVFGDNEWLLQWQIIVFYKMQVCVNIFSHNLTFSEQGVWFLKTWMSSAVHF